MTSSDSPAGAPQPYSPARNIVRRPDGIRVNVARFRGQLFVCDSGCCCGRTEDGFAPVPAGLYHVEWERRRLRNFVHLTIGGCLGPCALANVVLLLFDGEAIWLHSMGADEQIIALYDHIEALLDADVEADGVLPLPPALAEFQFTATTWQDRPDGHPLDDHRQWRVHQQLPASDQPHVCPAPPAPRDAPAPVDLAIARMRGLAALPRKNGEVVFDAPWQGRAFGMTTAMHEDGRFDWDDFRDKLIARIAVAERTAAAEDGGPFDYYACWVSAFEALLAEGGIVSPEELDERAAEFEFGEREEVY